MYFSSIPVVIAVLTFSTVSHFINLLLFFSTNFCYSLKVSREPVSLSTQLLFRPVPDVDSVATCPLFSFFELVWNGWFPQNFSSTVQQRYSTIVWILKWQKYPGRCAGKIRSIFYCDYSSVWNGSLFHNKGFFFHRTTPLFQQQKHMGHQVAGRSAQIPLMT